MENVRPDPEVLRLQELRSIAQCALKVMDWINGDGEPFNLV